MLAHKLDARKQQILWAVIQEYVARAEPVASEAVCHRYGLGVSAATIRNGMHALTEMGYLYQPHTSAGRVPTDRAYRVYVDRLMAGHLLFARDSWLSSTERERIRRRLQGRDDPEEALTEAAQTLAALTDYPSVASTSGGPRQLRRLHLIPLVEDRALMVVVTEGAVEQRVVRLHRPATEDELRRVSQLVTQALAGRTISDLSDSEVERLGHGDLVARDLVVAVVEHLRRYGGLRTGVRFFVEGVSNILKQPEFQDVRRARPVLAALDREEVLRDVLLPAPADVHVRIGRENPVDDIRGCSVVAAAYRVRGRIVGVVGVVGPTRMPYARTIALVRYLAQTLSDTLSRVV
ncbi:MAG: heat-inducible transcription repressor HrcA [candidate division GAL15 bacterium]